MRTAESVRRAGTRLLSVGLLALACASEVPPLPPDPPEPEPPASPALEEEPTPEPVTQEARDYDAAVLLANDATRLILKGEPAQALPRLDEAIPLFESSAGPDHAVTLRARTYRAETLASLGETEAAAAEFLNITRAFEESVGPDDPALARPLVGLAGSRNALGDYDAACTALERALPLAGRSDLVRPKAIAYIHEGLAECALRAGNGLAAARHYELALDSLNQQDVDTGARDALVRLHLETGSTHFEQERPGPAIHHFERALAMQEDTGAPPVALGATLSALGRAHVMADDPEAARPYLERAVALLEPELGKLDPLVLTTRAALVKLPAP